MTFVVDARTIGMWHMQVTPTSDVMMGLGVGDDGALTLTWRFRYDAGTPAERKSWHSNRAKPGSTPEECIATVRAALAQARAAHPGGEPPFELLMDERGVEPFMARLRKRIEIMAFIPAAATNEEALETYRRLMTVPPAGRA